MTFAMFLATRRLPIPKEYYYHSPLLTDIYGNTVAMIYATMNCKIPDEWTHKP